MEAENRGVQSPLGSPRKEIDLAEGKDPPYLSRTTHREDRAFVNPLLADLSVCVYARATISALCVACTRPSARAQDRSLAASRYEIAAAVLVVRCSR